MSKIIGTSGNTETRERRESLERWAQGITGICVTRGLPGYLKTLDHPGPGIIRYPIVGYRKYRPVNLIGWKETDRLTALTLLGGWSPVLRIVILSQRIEPQVRICLEITM